MIDRCKRLFPVLTVALASVLVSGCSETDLSATGVVQFSDGELVQSGSIEFRSLDDGSRYASRIRSNGAFTLTDANGVERCPPGNYEVVVVQIVLTEDLAAEDHMHGRTVPRRYADYYTSDLRVNNTDAAPAPHRIVLEAS